MWSYTPAVMKSFILLLVLLVLLEVKLEKFEGPKSEVLQDSDFRFGFVFKIRFWILTSPRTSHRSESRRRLPGSIWWHPIPLSCCSLSCLFSIFVVCKPVTADLGQLQTLTLNFKHGEDNSPPPKFKLTVTIGSTMVFFSV
jgi:hypothetical protein